MKKILVTGSLGLVGSNLIKYLTMRGMICIPFDCRADAQQNIQHLESLMAVEPVEGIVHLAGTSRVVLGQQNPEQCRLNNVLGTKWVIKKALAQQKKPWVLFTSSREVYGQQASLPVQEDCQRDPMNVYAKSKHLAEDLLMSARAQGLRTAIVRLSNVFGGLTDHANRVIPAFCQAALNNGFLKLEGADNIFDFTYIDDVCDGLGRLIMLLNTTTENYPPIHFVNNRGVSLKEAASIIIDIAKGGKTVNATPRNYDVSRFYGDYSRAKKLLGWQPQYTFETAIARFIHDLKNNPFKAVLAS